MTLPTEEEPLGAPAERGSTALHASSDDSPGDAERPADHADGAGHGVDNSPRDGGGGTWIGPESWLRRPGTIPFGLLVILTLAWAWKFSTLVMLRQNRFGSFDFDSGIFGQAAWLAAHGAQFDTVRGLPLYGHHATFGFYFFAPFYWLGFDGPTVMNVAQVLALAAVPLVVYWLARRVGLQPWIACVAGAVCLSHFSMTWLAQELFHPEVFAIAPLLAAYGFALRNQNRAYWAMLVFAILWKEDVALTIIGLGALLLIRTSDTERGPQRRRGVFTIVFAVIWFAIATQILLPHFSPTGKAFYAEGFYGDLGNNFTGVASSFVLHPGLVATHLHKAHTVGYLRDLWAPFAFVNLLEPFTLLLAIPQLLANLLSVNSFTWSLHYHYVALPLTATMLGFVLGLRRLKGRYRSFAAGLALAACIATALSWGVGPYSANYRTGYWPLATNAQQQTDQAQIRHALSLIPAHASVSASYHLVPHLTDRTLIFSFPNPWTPRNWGINDKDQRDPSSVEWLVAIRADLGGKDQAVLESLLTGPTAWTTVYATDVVVLARRDPGSG